MWQWLYFFFFNEANVATYKYNLSKLYFIFKVFVIVDGDPAAYVELKILLREVPKGEIPLFTVMWLYGSHMTAMWLQSLV